ncbi:hypothetical protein LIER_41439 [Lithospermum erythrorhizon]|uniref:Uncharacterized protein n=1 Tax=Lithospermum erythrorhizon TaxID=34254 RepID=A0AAV3R9C7_LITER
MEGGGPEIENMVFSNNLNESVNGEGEKKQEDKKESEVAEVNGESEKGSGVISNFISAFVSTRGKDEQEENVQVNKSDAINEVDKEEKEGGLLNHLISIVTPNQHGNYTGSDDGENALNSEVGSGKNENQEKIVEDEDGGGGGVIRNFISNIMHHNNGENNKSGEDGQLIEDGGGGGKVESGDSHLPTKNDAGDRLTEPGIEEASILIHSIVHD